MKRTVAISEDALAQLQRHDWPGNIRELRNVLEFSAYLSHTGVIERGDLPENIGPAARDTTSLYDRVRRFERAEIRRALEFHGSDLAGKRAAAEELGISREPLQQAEGRGKNLTSRTLEMPSKILEAKSCRRIARIAQIRRTLRRFRFQISTSRTS